ncbi:MAG: YHYH protein, partial [Phototrophicaceae bacterium]
MSFYWRTLIGALMLVALVGQPSYAQTDPNCPTASFVDVSSYVQTQAYPEPMLAVRCAGDTLIIESNTIPNFEFVAMTPNALVEAQRTYEIPLTPTMADTPSDIPLLGPIGVAVNGLPINGPNEAQDLGFGDPYTDGLLDFCGGHTSPQEYHLHRRPDCLFDNIEGNPDLIVGYSFDGYAIYAPFVCEDAACTTVREVQSSWQRTSDVTAAWDAHEYVAGSGDLDECNGMMGDDGVYRYFATDTFPYFLGCYVGEPSSSASMEQGGQGG